MRWESLDYIYVNQNTDKERSFVKLVRNFTVHVRENSWLADAYATQAWLLLRNKVTQKSKENLQAKLTKQSTLVWNNNNRWKHESSNPINLCI